VWCGDRYIITIRYFVVYRARHVRSGKRLRTVYRWSDENCSAADGVRAIACISSRVRVCVCVCLRECKCVPAKRTASTGIQCRCARRVGRAVGPAAASRRRRSGRGRGRPAIGRPGVPGRGAAAMGTARAVPHRRPRNTHLGFFRKEGKRIRYARPNNTLSLASSLSRRIGAHGLFPSLTPPSKVRARCRLPPTLLLLQPLFVLSSRFLYHLADLWYIRYTRPWLSYVYR